MIVRFRTILNKKSIFPPETRDSSWHVHCIYIYMNSEEIIYLVDNDVLILDELEYSLTLVGFNIRKFSSAESALQYLPYQKPSIVITDYLMSGMNGVQLIQELGKIDPSIKTMIISAFSEDKINKKNKIENPDHYLSKPVDFKKLLNLIKNIDKIQNFSQKKKSKILIADDEAIIRMSYQSMFSRMNYEVVCAGDGVTALEELKTGTFDLCILDINMPKMDGITVAKILRTEYKINIPVIIVSGSLEKEIEEALKANGINHYFSKPVMLQTLQQQVLSILNQK